MIAKLQWVLNEQKGEIQDNDIQTVPYKTIDEIYQDSHAYREHIMILGKGYTILFLNHDFMTNPEVIKAGFKLERKDEVHD